MLSIVPFLTLVLQDRLQIDPLLLVEAKETWSVIGRADNPVWRGWDARKTPILIYFPGRQDVLVNHPNPPSGFHSYKGALSSPIGPIYVRDGKTFFDLDGQNTSTDLNGVQTLVVADTQSNRRGWIVNLGPEPDPEQVANSLLNDAFDSMTMFAHEAFHVYQHKMAPDKHGDEESLCEYPSLSVENNVGFALEADFLSAALHAQSQSETRNAGLKWLAARQARRAAIGKKAADYEDGTEFNEGLAKYVEYKLLECLQGRKPAQEMWFVQGFPGYGDLSAERERLVRAMAGFMTGRSSVNNDLYGASPVRFRLYYSGMSIAALLDRLGMDWQDRILKTKASLTDLATEALKPTPDELTKARQEIEASPRYRELKTAKEQLAKDGAIHIQKTLQTFEDAPGILVLDYSKTTKKPEFTFTPFGILRIDDDRSVFRLVPIRGQIDKMSFAEDGARPVMHDRKAKKIYFQLTAQPTEEATPGITLTNAKGRRRLEGGRLTIELSAGDSRAN